MDGPVETRPGCYQRFYELLRDAVAQGGPPPVDPADAIASLRVIEAAFKSAQTGEVVRLG
jgi:scyllo-inositol 2-dehydrogenase (NADP+)